MSQVLSSNIQLTEVPSFRAVVERVAAILLVLSGGVLIDRLGTRKASLLFSILVLLGSLIVWRAESIPLIFIGRFIFEGGNLEKGKA